MKDSDFSAPIPLIIVEGFLSTTGAVAWSRVREYIGGYENKLGKRMVMIASVGPVSSLHDRACELYYTIKGGIVDYGEEHARQHRHKRFGRHHPTGLFPNWSASNPLHFLGHSIGGATIMKLQYLLAIGFFGHGQEAHPDMLFSVTTVSTPFRGTQLVYTLGERTDNAPAVRPFSVGSLIAKAVHVLSYFSPLLPHALDLHADSRSLSYQECSFTEFLRHLWKSDWAEGRDATPFDVTFEAADERDAEGEGECNDNTFYMSFTAFFTRAISTEDGKHSPPLSNMRIPPLYFSALSIGSFDFDSLLPRPSFLPSSDPSPSRDDNCGSITPSSLELDAEDNDADIDEDNDNSDCDSEFCQCTFPVRVKQCTCLSTPSTPPLPTPTPTPTPTPIHLRVESATERPTLSEHYWANDGVVPVFSQWHPRECSATRCVHHEALSSPRLLLQQQREQQRVSEKDRLLGLEPGVWNVYTLEDAHHLSILPLWVGSSRQEKFWEELGDYLDSIDAHKQTRILDV